MSRIDEVLSLTMKFLNIILYFAVFFGVSIYVYYSVNIVHIPVSGLSFGDTLLFVSVLMFFIILYFIFTFCIAYTTLPFVVIFLWVLKKLSSAVSQKLKNKINHGELNLSLFPKDSDFIYKSSQFIIWLFAALVFLLLIYKEAANTLQFLLGAFAMGFLLLVIINSLNKVNPKIILTDNNSQPSEKDYQNKILLVLILSVLLLISPSMLGMGIFHFSNINAFRLINISISKDTATVYLKDPFSAIVSSYVQPSTNGTTKEDFVKFDNTVDILFNGFGSTTVISFPIDSPKDERKMNKVISVPNEYIIIERTINKK